MGPNGILDKDKYRQGTASCAQILVRKTLFALSWVTMDRIQENESNTA
jgi:hypothetical protein